MYLSRLTFQTNTVRHQNITKLKMSRCEIRSTVKVSKRESESQNSKQKHNKQYYIIHNTNTKCKIQNAAARQRVRGLLTFYDPTNGPDAHCQHWLAENMNTHNIWQGWCLVG